MKNTVADFIETANDKQKRIVCPACGAPMGVGSPGSFHFMLTDRGRGHLDDKLHDLRCFLEGIEDELERRNVAYQLLPAKQNPYLREEREHLESLHLSVTESPGAQDRVAVDEYGNYSGVRSSQEVKNFVDSWDGHDWVSNFSEFPLLNTKELNKLVSQSKERLIPGSEPKRLRLLMDVVFQQQELLVLGDHLGLSVAPTTSPEEIDKNKDILQGLLKEVCPYYSSYLNKCEKKEKESVQADSDLSAKQNETLTAIKRTQLILALLIGHKGRTEDSEKSKERKALFGDAVIPGKPYHLPERTFVSITLLRLLLNSRLLLSGNAFDFSPDFTQTLFSSNKSDRQGSGNETLWNSELQHIVHFTCANAPAGQQTCGWYPKEGPTHSIVLLGSPGSGKTSMMISGLGALYSYISQMNCAARPEGVLARTALHDLDLKYREGTVEKPTGRGTKERIELSIERIDEPAQKVHFVFIDVAGEDVTSMVTGEGANPDLRRILRHAGTIVFQFDLTIEPSIRDILTSGQDAGIWGVVQENFNRVNKERDNNASFDQFNLLEELVYLLESEKGENRLSETNFVCVVPKADLFAVEADEPRFFLNDFFQYLVNMRLIVRSPHAPTEDLKGMHSLARIEMAPEFQKGAAKPLTGVDVCRAISDKARESLCNIGDSFAPDVEEENKEMLVAKIKKGLIDFLQHRFGEENSYFLPISALGKDTRDLLEDRTLGHKPNQKLSEYVFLLPIALALGDVQSAKHIGSLPSK